MTNSKQTKKALYSSVVSLLLCFVMLIGTTFAWFTDNASTSVNKIQAGNLDVALEMKVGDDWESVEGKTLDFVKATGHENEKILWEPGCTYSLPELRIKNNGNLALKYKVVITGIKGDAKLNDAIEWTIGEAVVGSEQTLGAEESKEFTISGTMRTDAGNEYQGLSIDGIAITVYAKQYTAEYDSTTNDYDKDAEYDIPWDGTSEGTVPEAGQDGNIHISTVEQFVALMNTTQGENSVYSGKTIVLDCDINFGGNTIKGIGSDFCNFAGTFDGSGHTISNFVIDATNREHYAGLFNYVGNVGSVKNLTVKNATVSGQGMVGAVVGGLYGSATVSNCKVYNSTLSGVKKVGAVVGYAEGTTASVTDNYAENCAVYYSNTDGSQILGYQNNGVTVSNNSYKNVKVESGRVSIVSKAAELAEKLTANEASINVTLASDITMDIASLGTITGGSGQYKLGGVNTTAINIDLNGHKLTLNTTYWSALGANNNNAVITVKNGSMNSSQTKGTWNSYDLTFYDCKWNFENVTFDKAVAIATGADTTMNNVIINESNSAEAAYALWITAEGQTVNLNNVTIQSNGGKDTRAIAIKDQYVKSPEKVTLTIKDSEISSTSKAAVLVTSKTGAVINASNVDISGVDADSTNLVWVDNDAAYSNLKDVTVTGGTAIVEK